MTATVFDVAKEAGVSIATVSRVMNNSPRVSAATAEAVRAAVEKLGYVPNQQARNLRKNESNAVLVMIPDVTKLSYARILAGINEKALEAINALEKELSTKLGEDISLVAYSPVSYADLNADAEALAQICDLEKKLSEQTSKKIVLVAFSV